MLPPCEKVYFAFQPKLVFTDISDESREKNIHIQQKNPKKTPKSQEKKVTEKITGKNVTGKNVT